MTSASTAVGLYLEAPPGNQDLAAIEDHASSPSCSKCSDLATQVLPPLRISFANSLEVDACLKKEEETQLPTDVNLISRFDVICRFCLLEKESLIDIFRWSDHAAVMVESLVSIKIKEDDMLPQQVCADCYELLNQCLAFKEQVASADSALQRCIDQLKQIEIGIRKEVFEASDLGITSQHIFVDSFALKELNESHKIEELTGEEDDTAGDEMVWEKDVNLYSEEDRKLASFDGNAIIFSAESKSDPRTSPIDVISSSSKRQPKSRTPVKCQQCGKAFSCDSHLQQHFHPHDTDKLKTESVPSKTFCREAKWKEHMTSRKSPNEDAEEQTNSFKCAKCNARFTLEHDLHIHGSTHPEDDKIQCRECGKDFSTITKLQRHVKMHYESKARCLKRKIPGHTNVKKPIRPISRKSCDKRFVCKKCNKSFKLKCNLLVHLRLHRGQKSYKCSECSKTFGLQSTLTNHFRTHTGEKPYKCPHCSKCFARSSGLVIHIRTHTGEKPYKCPCCSKSFKISSALADHIRTHTGEKPYKCPHCSKASTTSSGLRSHIRTHTVEKPYKCPHCSMSFAVSNRLAIHVRTHTREKAYKCPHCSKLFAKNYGLAAHIRTHTGEKPYKCSQCPKSFNDSSTLIGHVRTHTGEKPHKCPHCSNCFAWSSSLVIHLRTHTGEKPYKCHHCTKSFANRSGLTIHVRRHTGEKPFKCSQCSKSFCASSALADHVRRHKSEKPHKRLQC